MAVETEPDPGTPNPQVRRWNRVDVDGDDYTLWVHFHKGLRDRLHGAEVDESDGEVKIALLISTVAETDPRWKELADEPRLSLPECVRIHLDAPLGDRRCYEVLRGNDR